MKYSNFLLLFCENLITKIRLGFDYNDADLRNHIYHTKVPVLIVGTKIDNVTPFEMAQELFDTILHQKKTLFIVENSQHADIVYDYPLKYDGCYQFFKHYTTIQIISK